MWARSGKSGKKLAKISTTAKVPASVALHICEEELSYWNFCSTIRWFRWSFKLSQETPWVQRALQLSRLQGLCSTIIHTITRKQKFENDLTQKVHQAESIYVDKIISSTLDDVFSNMASWSMIGSDQTKLTENHVRELREFQSSLITSRYGAPEYKSNL